MKKFIFIVFTCFVLAVPCFADDGIYFADTLTITGSHTRVFDFASDSGYFFIKGSSNYISVWGISSIENDIFTITYDGNEVTSYTCSYNQSGYYIASSPGLTVADNTTISPNIIFFDENTSNGDIVSAFDDFIANNPVIPNTKVSFTLPRGNVLYFKVAENQNVHFESDFMSNSALFSSGTYGPWGDTQQRFGAVSALPTNSTVFPLSSQNPITWYKSPNRNVLGQTKTGLASVSCVINQYYCFYNPAFSYVSDTQERDSVGGTVRVNGSFAEIKIYPLSQQLTIENGQVLLNSDSNDGYASYFDGTSNENGTVTFTDQDGNIDLPVNGGQNQQDAPVTAQGLIEGIKGTLQNILREIENLFTFGYKAIQSLVSTISEFTSVFAQLYTWLPTPVYQALISAIIIAITIGVFKVFL